MGIQSRSGNGALSANPNIFNYYQSSDINITTHGSDWYWAVTAVMAASTIAFLATSLMVTRERRIFHYITAAITLTASIAYFSMASNLGYTPIAVEFQRNNAKVAGFTREIFYVRYIDWFVTTPLLLLDLLLTAGVPWPTILYTIFLDEVMIITGLVGALVASSYKWGYFTFATVALVGIAYNVVFVGLKHSRALGSTVNRTFMVCGVWTIFLWFIYPIAWGLSEGGNVISPDSEAVFYGILDILAKPIFGILLLVGHRNIDPATLGLYIRDYQTAPTNRNHAHGRHLGSEHNALDAEKDGLPAHNNNGVFHNSGSDAVATGGITGTHANHSAVGQTV
ncbi:Protein FDD123 [Lachnellula hyalina]|uniref:Protein FDD123 n=1 Tax=Lachnellula hyalina TaxID=1316788 RepID=A0A8H8QYI3_9HELO|nr:Protein FDD123 [Lachnellula hyalina]TVY24485.1 Protein FDD123 [Lachnellula hyalina]